jgi:chemotaxis regulatin CheY-phosphate phosphatase CheZ
MLESAILQTEGKKIKLDNKWKELLRDKIREVDFAGIAKDVKQFLENPEEAKLMTKNNILKLLK